MEIINDRYTIAEASKQFGIQINELTRAMRESRLPKHTNIKSPYTISYDELTSAFPDLMSANDIAEDVFTTFSASRKFFIEEWKIAKAIQSGSLPATKVNGSDIFTKDDFISVFPHLNEATDSSPVFAENVIHVEPVNVPEIMVNQVVEAIQHNGPPGDAYLLTEDVTRIFSIGITSVNRAVDTGVLKYRFNLTNKEFKVSDLYSAFPSLKLRGGIRINTNSPVSVELLDKCYTVCETTIRRRISTGDLRGYSVNGKVSVWLNEFKDIFPRATLRQYVEVDFVSEPPPASIVPYTMASKSSGVAEVGDTDVNLKDIISKLESIVTSQQQQIDQLLVKLSDKVTTPTKRWWEF